MSRVTKTVPIAIIVQQLRLCKVRQCLIVGRCRFIRRPALRNPEALKSFGRAGLGAKYRVGLARLGQLSQNLSQVPYKYLSPPSAATSLQPLLIHPLSPQPLLPHSRWRSSRISPLWACKSLLIISRKLASLSVHRGSNPHGTISMPSIVPSRRSAEAARCSCRCWTAF